MSKRNRRRNLARIEKTRRSQKKLKESNELSNQSKDDDTNVDQVESESKDTAESPNNDEFVKSSDLDDNAPEVSGEQDENNRESDDTEKDHTRADVENREDDKSEKEKSENGDSEPIDIDAEIRKDRRRPILKAANYLVRIILEMFLLFVTFSLASLAIRMCVSFAMNTINDIYSLTNSVNRSEWIYLVGAFSGGMASAILIMYPKAHMRIRKTLIKIYKSANSSVKSAVKK